jgi:hypothetical protein
MAVITLPAIVQGAPMTCHLNDTPRYQRWAMLQSSLAQASVIVRLLECIDGIDEGNTFTLTDGQSTELVHTVCTLPGLTHGTVFELCLAETSGAMISCPTPVRLHVGPTMAIFKG